MIYRRASRCFNSDIGREVGYDGPAASGSTGKSIAKCRDLKLTLQARPSQPRCCPNMDFRSIPRGELENTREAARGIAKTRQYEVSMKLRKLAKILPALQQARNV